MNSGNRTLVLTTLEVDLLVDRQLRDELLQGVLGDHLAPQLGDLLAQLALCGDHHLEAQPLGAHPQVVQRHHVHRVRDGHAQDALAHGQRQDDVLDGDAVRDPPGDSGIDDLKVEVNHLQAMHVRQRGSDGTIGDEAGIDKHPAEAPADRPPVPSLGLEGSLELLRSDDTPADQRVAELPARHSAPPSPGVIVGTRGSRVEPNGWGEGVAVGCYSSRDRSNARGRPVHPSIREAVLAEAKEIHAA